MKCYNHHDRDAFGICKVCGKALCLECMAQDRKNVVCANDKSCLDKEAQYNIYYKNANVYYSAKTIAWTKLLGVIALVIGIFLAVIGFCKNLDPMDISLSIACILSGIIIIRRTNELSSIDDNKKTNRTLLRYILAAMAILVVIFLLNVFLSH